MSLAAVRAALEVALAAITPALPTAWENAPYTPEIGVAYQQVSLLRAPPSNIEIGPGFVEQGIFQVSLLYPVEAGPHAAEARADLIRDTFPFGASFSSGGITVTITGTPEVAPSRIEDDRYFVPVKVRFSSFIGG